MHLPVIEPALSSRLSRSAPTKMTEIFRLTDRKIIHIFMYRMKQKLKKGCLYCQMTSALLCRLSDLSDYITNTYELRNACRVITYLIHVPMCMHAVFKPLFLRTARFQEPLPIQQHLEHASEAGQCN